MTIQSALFYVVKLSWFWDLFFFFFQREKDALTSVSENEYRNIFIKGRTKEQIEMTYRRAWEAKNFEIELYWKRATYFWAFQIASFAGYFAVLNSTYYKENYKTDHHIVFFVICVGVITSLAWAFINQGSKVWQRHWEIHVDMLEDEITGPLYKIVTAQKTFSVSKINDIVSRFIACIWLLFAIKYLVQHLTLNPVNNNGIDWLVVGGTTIVLYFAGAMYWGHGRGRFGERKVKFFSRKFRPQ
jgi:hypothetical protein